MTFADISSVNSKIKERTVKVTQDLTALDDSNIPKAVSDRSSERVKRRPLSAFILSDTDSNTEDDTSSSDLKLRVDNGSPGRPPSPHFPPIVLKKLRSLSRCDDLDSEEIKPLNNKTNNQTSTTDHLDVTKYNSCTSEPIVTTIGDKEVATNSSLQEELSEEKKSSIKNSDPVTLVNNCCSDNNAKPANNEISIVDEISIVELTAETIKAVKEVSIQNICISEEYQEQTESLETVCSSVVSEEVQKTAKQPETAVLLSPVSTEKDLEQTESLETVCSSVVSEEVQETVKQPETAVLLSPVSTEKDQEQTESLETVCSSTISEEVQETAKQPETAVLLSPVSTEKDQEQTESLETVCSSVVSEEVQEMVKQQETAVLLSPVSTEKDQRQTELLETVCSSVVSEEVQEMVKQQETAVLLSPVSTEKDQEQTELLETVCFSAISEEVEEVQETQEIDVQEIKLPSSITVSENIGVNIVDSFMVQIPQIEKKDNIEDEVDIPSIIPKNKEPISSVSITPVWLYEKRTRLCIFERYISLVKKQNRQTLLETSCTTSEGSPEADDQIKTDKIILMWKSLTPEQRETLVHFIETFGSE